MPKSDFLPIWTRTITHKEPMNTTSFGEPSLLIEYYYEKHYCLLFISIHKNYLKKLILRHFWNSQIFWNVSLWHDQVHEELFRLFSRITFKKENMGRVNFKKLFKFRSFSQIFYCAVTRLMNISLENFDNILSQG